MFPVERPALSLEYPYMEGLAMTTWRIDTELPGDSEVVLRLVGDLDLASCDELDAVLRGFQLDGRPNITLDLSGLTFMDSSGLRPIVAAGQRARMSGGSLLIRRPPKQVRHVLELAGVAHLLTFTP
jgi:anti-sigma B factor antagonist